MHVIFCSVLKQTGRWRVQNIDFAVLLIEIQMFHICLSPVIYTIVKRIVKGPIAKE